MRKLASNLTVGRRRVLLTACLGAFMATMDMSLVNVALPQIAQGFGSSLAQISWVMVAYLLANASLLVASGRLSDLLSPGKLFLTGVCVFAGASIFCGLSPKLSWLIVGRVLQGVGASLMLGVAPKLLTLAYREGERGLALGLYSTAFAGGVTLGTPLGGVILTHLNWHFVFFVNIFIGSVAVMMGVGSLLQFKAEKAWDWRALDPWGCLTLTGTLAFFILTLTWIREHGFGNSWNIGALVFTGGVFSFLLWHEGRQSTPLLHKELWRRRGFILGSIGVLLAFASVMGSFFLLPFFLGQIFAYKPDKIGLMMAVLSVSNALVSPVGGYFGDRIGNLRILRIGTVLIVLGLFSLAYANPEHSTLNLAGRLVLTGLGFGLFSAPNLNEILRGVRPSLLGLAASTNAVLKNLGSLLGVVTMVSVFSIGQLHQVNLKMGVGFDISFYQQAFLCAAGIAAVNVLANLLPRDSLRKAY